MFEIQQVCRSDICHFGDVFSVEAGLNFDLTFEVELLCITLTSLVPLFKDFSESSGVDFDELLRK